jgi:hypothetical protein
MTIFLHFSPICIQLNAALLVYRIYRTLLGDCELRDNI